MLASQQFVSNPFYCPTHQPPQSPGSAPSSLAPIECKVTIPRTENRTDVKTGKEYTVFLLTVKTCCNKWTVYRRYSEFVELDAALQKAHPHAKLPKLPPKKLLGSSLDTEFVRQRRMALQEMMQNLLREPELFDSTVLFHFLSGKQRDVTAALHEQYFDLCQQVTTIAQKVQQLESQLKRVEFVAKTAMKHNAAKSKETEASSGGDGVSQQDILFLKRKLFMLEKGLDKDNLEITEGDLDRWQHRSQSTYTATVSNLSHAFARRDPEESHAPIRWTSRRSHSTSQLALARSRFVGDGRKDLLQGYFESRRPGFRPTRTVSLRFTRDNVSENMYARDRSLSERQLRRSNPIFVKTHGRRGRVSRLGEIRSLGGSPISSGDNSVEQMSPATPDVDHIQSSPLQVPMESNLRVAPHTDVEHEEAADLVRPLVDDYDDATMKADEKAPAQASQGSHVPDTAADAKAPPKPLTPSMIEGVLSNPYLAQSIDDLIDYLQPNPAAEIRRLEVLSFIEALIKKSMGAQVFCHGSFALKSYLPDGDLDISAFFSRGHDTTWVQRVVSTLCTEANSDQEKYRVTSVSFINADVRVVKLQVAGIAIDISGNQVGGLANLALFETVDRMIGNQHLFKRTLLLVKAWAVNEAKICDSSHGFLSSYGFRAFLLFIFNAYHTRIRTPLEGLYLLLMYLSEFNWLEHGLGLFGPIKLDALPRFEVITEGPCAWPKGATPLISQELLQRYSTAYTRDSNSSAFGTVQDRRCMTIVDPLNPLMNVAKSVDYRNASTIANAFKQGAQQLHRVFNDVLGRHDVKQCVDGFFRNTLLAYAEAHRMNETYVADDPAAQENVGDVLESNLEQILDNLAHARQFEIPDITEGQLVGLVSQILTDHGPVPVGKMGSLLHTVTNNHSLPAMLKERYGGLKKFLHRHEQVFVIGNNHPYNPHVYLRSQAPPAALNPQSSGNQARAQSRGQQQRQHHQQRSTSPRGRSHPRSSRVPNQRQYSNERPTNNNPNNSSQSRKKNRSRGSHQHHSNGPQQPSHFSPSQQGYNPGYLPNFSMQQGQPLPPQPGRPPYNTYHGPMNPALHNMPPPNQQNM